MQYLSATHRAFDKLETAVGFADANLDAGDTLVVFEDDNATGPGVLVNSTEFSDGSSVDASGDLVVASGADADPIAFDRDLQTVTTYTRTNSGNCIVIRTDGVRTVLGYDRFVECFNATTGASVWVFDFDTGGGDFVRDLCIVAGFVYVVHDISGAGADADGSKQLHKLDLVDGSIAWSYAHSAAGPLRSVCCNGRQVFVSGDVSSFASNASLRSVNASNGFDVAGEGGVGTDLTGLTWDQNVGALVQSGVMDCDGHTIYLGRDEADTNQLEARSQADGETAWVYAHPDATQFATHVSVDQEYVYVSYSDVTADGFLQAHWKQHGGVAWRFGTPPLPVDRCVAAVSDGCAVFGMWPGDVALRRLTRGNVPTRFRVIDRDTELVRYRNWKLQPEDQ